ncbi:sce7726 family protein [Pantoea agglomerans]|uniref:sce7726 family protein n=1 Tax=Enterobacter agglomerans TaxID=549 RepID=UPI00045CCF6A|nr:sce7726 family protein [Pantoea agglomerans]KDA93299.1 protein cII [Pantoea agglomerans Eh318]
MKEIEIKKILIESLIKCKANVISSEFRFDFGTRRADVISMFEGKLTAYEIKGAKDNTDRLDKQIESYKKYFDLCFVVCEKSNLDSIRNKIPRNVGVLLVENETIIQIRKPYYIKNHNKISLASTIDIRHLRKIVANNKIKSKHELCEILANQKTLDEIRIISRTDAFQKIAIPFGIFLKEVGERIHSDDILTLTRMSSLELVL